MEMEREILNEGERAGRWWVPALALLTIRFLISRPNFASFSLCCIMEKSFRKILLQSVFVCFFLSSPLFFLVLLLPALTRFRMYF